MIYFNLWWYEKEEQEVAHIWKAVNSKCLQKMTKHLIISFVINKFQY